MKRKIIALILNIVIIILEAIGFVIAVGNHGVGIFVYYTQLSNLLLMIASAVYVVYWFLGKSNGVPKMVGTFKYIATCLTLETFVTVVLVLIPMMLPYGTQWVTQLLFGEANLYHHFACPLLALVAFVFLEREFVPSKKTPVMAMIPTLVYAVVTTSLNVARLLDGPYPFLRVHNQPVWMSVMWFILIPGVGFLLALLVNWVKKVIYRWD